MKKYVIGIDFGTLSARAVLADCESGRQLSVASCPYKHGVMEKKLCTGADLPEGFALQHPEDYTEALCSVIRELKEKGGAKEEDIAAIGIDFTTCTLLPIDEEGKPLCLTESFKNEPHAYVKIWKHTSAQPEADEINALAKELGEGWISCYGGKLASQFALPKILETLREAPEVYEAAHRFIEAGDYINLALTGKESRGAAFAGYKAAIAPDGSRPTEEFLSRLDKRLCGIYETRLGGELLAAASEAGRVSSEGAARFGLAEGTVVATAMPDAHAAMPALGATEEGELMAVLGTSACYIINSKTKADLKGICGYVKDGIIPGAYTYEAGQAAVGDILASFVNNSVPADYEREAKELGIDLHALLSEKAKGLTAGESRLIALDWQGGNRSLLTDSSLRGVLVGMTLNTRPEEIYRALIEATAFGARMIVENYENGNIAVNRLFAAGGIAAKNELLMQIYADILNREIRVMDTSEAAALGSAIYASAAAGFFGSVTEAAERMSAPLKRIYTPIPDSVSIYNELFKEYKALHDYFGIENKGIFDRI